MFWREEVSWQQAGECASASLQHQINLVAKGEHAPGRAFSRACMKCLQAVKLASYNLSTLLFVHQGSCMLHGSQSLWTSLITWYECIMLLKFNFTAGTIQLRLSTGSAQTLPAPAFSNVLESRLQEWKSWRWRQEGLHCLAGPRKDQPIEMESV